jgi:hypothetical protein
MDTRKCYGNKPQQQGVADVTEHIACIANERQTQTAVTHIVRDNHWPNIFDAWFRTPFLNKPGSLENKVDCRFEFYAASSDYARLAIGHIGFGYETPLAPDDEWPNMHKDRDKLPVAAPFETTHLCRVMQGLTMIDKYDHLSDDYIANAGIGIAKDLQAIKRDPFFDDCQPLDGKQRTQRKWKTTEPERTNEPERRTTESK